MKPILIPLLILITFFVSCSSSDLNKRMDKLTTRMDSLEKNRFGIDLHPDDRTYKFEWFDLGKEGHQIIDGLFYVSDIKTSFKDNGYQVSGTIGNITTMTINNVIVECAIKDTTVKERVISGYSGAPTLFPGVKTSFDVFIPTTKTNVSEIGVLVRDYRM
mgnify:CR=1 FL=1